MVLALTACSRDTLAHNLKRNLEKDVLQKNCGTSFFREKYFLRKLAVLIGQSQFFS